MNHRFTLIAAALALAGLSTAASAQNTVRIGYSHVEPHSSASDATGPFLLGPPSGVSLSVKNQDTLFLSFAHSFNNNMEVELALGYPPTHDVTAQLNPAIVPAYIVSSFQGQVIAKVRQVAPTLFFNYKFGEPQSAWRPFVGLGINYTRFDKRESTATGNALNGGPTDISLSDSWGLAAQAGVSYRFSDKWTLNAAVATARVKTHLTATTAGAARNIDIRFRPTVLTFSVGYDF
ncbi:OmpW/AlkL family protein [Variovorax terrae]|uniref:TonB-dependent receptor n=1 Tax=Variovorax terrae TaxID=2923278 RepID=A0A9X1VYA4_9BURK|nr:OmpW family outer membrane protein [Variovorax terrae]MCJ0765871.1 TonB-dependent receptor [Variovorax terrae]